jgi:uncharacterized membrane protein
MVIPVGIQNPFGIWILAGSSMKEGIEMMGMMSGAMEGMMNGYGGMMSGPWTVAMGVVMGFSALLVLAVAALVLLAIVWLVRDLRSPADRTRGDSTASTRA